MKYLINNNILAQQHYIPVYKYKVYKESINDFKGSKKYFNNAVSIPIFVDLNYKDQKKIIEVIKRYF